MAVALLVVAIAGAVVAAIYWGRQKNDSNDMKPLGLGDFSVTQCQEGSAFPLLWGTKKITSNILWYGNLVSEEQYQETGGKGGGDDTVSGYRYFMDMWLALCWSPHGGASVLDVYSGGESVGISGLGTYYLNPGNTAYYPTEPGAYANKMPGLAHIFLDKFDLGTNTSYVPNLEFVIKNTSNCSLTHTNMTEGVNPAAIVWDVLALVGVPTSSIDSVSFQSAADYWYDKGYGLNVVLQSQKFADEMIAELLTYVDFSLYQDDTGLWILVPFKSTDTYVSTLNTDDMKDFRYIRKSWDDTSNDFRATYIDEDQEYTQRNVCVDNIASINLVEHRIEKSLDLTAFNQLDTASKRLTEIMKVYSYPSAQIQVSVPYRHITLNIGEIVRINNTDYDIEDQDFRVVSIEETDDSNYVRLTLNEMTEGLFDDNYNVAGGTSWTDPDYSAQSLAYQKIFEMPFSESIGTTTTFLCLGHRKGIENGFTVYKTTSGGADATFVANLTTFSTRGTLAADYLIATGRTIDDDVGILLTPYTFDPSWNTISRTNLFNTRRILVCGNEIMAFQSIVPEGVSSYRLKGVMRGILGTPVENHTSGTEIWITTIDDNLIATSGGGTTYYKFVPFVGGKLADISTCTTITATSTLKALTPLAPTRLVATRVGANVSVVVIPSVYNPDKILNSAGTKDATLQTDKSAYDYLGYLQYKYGATWIDVALGTHTFNFNQGGAFTIYVRYNNGGLEGQQSSVYVTGSDGTYYGGSV